MPTKNTRKTNTSSVNRLKSTLSPTTPKKTFVLFILIFAVLGGGFMTYKSFAVASSRLRMGCYLAGNSYQMLAYGQISPNQSYSIAFQDGAYVKGKENPTYIAAEGKANGYGTYSTGVYVARGQWGYYSLYTLQNGSYVISETNVYSSGCTAGPA